MNQFGFLPLPLPSLLLFVLSSSDEHEMEQISLSPTETGTSDSSVGGLVQFSIVASVSYRASVFHFYNVMADWIVLLSKLQLETCFIALSI